MKIAINASNSLLSISVHSWSDSPCWFVYLIIISAASLENKSLNASIGDCNSLLYSVKHEPVRLSNLNKSV